MHPSISKFPNKKFYGGKIKDGTKEYDTIDIFLGHIFGPYSFIHVEDGTEQPIGQSLVNKVEAVVAASIVARLAEGIVSNFLEVY